ncbi:MAG: porin, partial [Thiohalorhabdaceae bacterium]
WYLEGGYFPIPNKLGVQARYDVLNRLTETPGSSNPGGERKFETVTLGLQYWDHPAKGQWSLNYRIRDLEAPNLAGNHPANKVGDAMGNEIGLQYFMLFKNVALR